MGHGAPGIKPYLPYADCHPEASGGFAHEVLSHALEVRFPEELLAQVPPAQQEALIAVLAQDPRPGYQHDPERIYGFPFGELEIRFFVAGDILTVTEIKHG